MFIILIQDQQLKTLELFLGDIYTCSWKKKLRKILLL